MGTHPIFESDFDCLTEMRFTRILTNKPYKTRMLKNELLKPWWEYTRAELVAKDFFKQGAPDLHADTDTRPRLAPHLDPGRPLMALPRDIEKFAAQSQHQANYENTPNRDVRLDQAYYGAKYCIVMDRIRCGGAPFVSADRDIFDIVLRDTSAFHKRAAMWHKSEKIDLELLGQYDGQPNKCNERVLSLDVDKVLYYVGCGVSLGQDFAELLGVVGLLPCHPSTQLRLRKVHETRANTVIKETPGMMGEVDLIEAARKRLALEDEHLYTKRDGFQEAGSELSAHHQRVEVAQQKRDKANREFNEMVEREKLRVSEMANKWKMAH